MKTISIVGTGYVGLTTAAILSNVGYKVFTVDIDPKKIEIIKSGRSYFYEVGLDEFVKKGIELGTLLPTTSFEESIPNSEIVLSCVGTPDREDGSPNLDFIFSAAESVVKLAKDGLIFAQKSTVPVGTARRLITHMSEIRPELKFTYISNPEFLSEGSAVYDTLNIDRLVVGGEDIEAINSLVEIFEKVDNFCKSLDLSMFSNYAKFYKSSKTDTLEKSFYNKVIKTNLESAELIKVTANAFLALKISFANSMAKLCDKSGADINEVMNGVGADERIGRSFLYSGLGWGGGCFPKDVNGLINVAQNHDVDMKILHASVSVNDHMSEYVVEKLKNLLVSLENKTIAVLGLSFKPGTSDVRKSPSIKLINKFLKLKNLNVKCYDPQAVEEAKKDLDTKVTICETIDECLKDVDAVVVATEWKEFLEYDWNKALKLMKGKVIMDARNRLDKEHVKSLGFVYEGVGRS
jgi:UDPglucose 6-dehydrogenase